MRVPKTSVVPLLRLCLLLPPVLCGCASPEVLLPMSATVPAGIDLSGQWRIRPSAAQGQPGIREAIDRTDGVDAGNVMRDLRDQQRRERAGMASGGETRGGLVHLFLKTGKSLKITQTPYALFVSFDRAVVEEYRFGEDRPISIGEAEAHRVSGWEGNAYVIQTLGEKGMKLTDRYSIAGDQQSLTRHIVLRGKDMKEVTIVQEFGRQDH